MNNPTVTAPQSHSLGALLNQQSNSPLKLLTAEAHRLNQLREQICRRLPPALAPHCLGGERETETGTLVIYMDSAATAMPVRYQQQQLLQRLAADNLRCTAVKVKILPEPPLPPGPKPSPRTLPDAVRQILENTAAGLEDGPLSRSLRRLARNRAPRR